MKVENKNWARCSIVPIDPWTITKKEMDRVFMFLQETKAKNRIYYANAMHITQIPLQVWEELNADYPTAKEYV